MQAQSGELCGEGIGRACSPSTDLLRQRKGSHANGGRPVRLGELELDLRLDLQWRTLVGGYRLSPAPARKRTHRPNSTAAHAAQTGLGRTSVVLKTLGSLINAWPFLQPGGSSPVHPIFRHSMIVCDPTGDGGTWHVGTWGRVCVHRVAEGGHGCSPFAVKASAGYVRMGTGSLGLREKLRREISALGGGAIVTGHGGGPARRFAASILPDDATEGHEHGLGNGGRIGRGALMGQGPHGWHTSQMERHAEHRQCPLPHTP